MESKPTIKELDKLFIEAARLVVQDQEASTSKLQRKFLLGYNRANKIMDQLEEHKIVGPHNGLIMRKVLVEDEEFLINLLKSEDTHDK